MERPLPFEVNTVIVCDDVRKEITNKDILIGVYTGDIVIPQLPAWIGLAVWIEIVPRKEGEHKIVFRVRMSNRAPTEIGIRLHIRNLDDPMGFALPGMQHLIEEETDFVVELKEGTEWRELKRKRILKGRVHLPFASPPIAGSLAGDG